MQNISHSIPLFLGNVLLFVDKSESPISRSVKNPLKQKKRCKWKDFSRGNYSSSRDLYEKCIR